MPHAAPRNDPATVNRLVANHWEFMRRVAWHNIRLRRPRDHDPILSDAAYGLLKAARGYDPTRGVPFTSYAHRRIEGEIIDGYRDRLGRKGEKITMAAEMLWQGEEPSTGIEFDTSEEDLLIRQVLNLFKILTPTEREVMTALYVDGKSQGEIADTRHVSASAVSIVHRRAVARMRRGMGLRPMSRAERGR